MSFEKVAFAFFIVMALTLNFGFFLGDIDVPAHHNVYELFAAIIISLIATIMKFGDRSQIGSYLLATSLVADVQLVIAALTWAIVVYGMKQPITPEYMSSIVSLSGGALLANITSVVLLVIEASRVRR